MTRITVAEAREAFSRLAPNVMAFATKRHMADRDADIAAVIAFLAQSAQDAAELAEWRRLGFALTDTRDKARAAVLAYKPGQDGCSTVESLAAAQQRATDAMRALCDYAALRLAGKT